MAEKQHFLGEFWEKIPLKSLIRLICSVVVFAPLMIQVLEQTFFLNTALTKCFSWIGTQHTHGIATVQHMVLEHSVWLLNIFGINLMLLGNLQLLGYGVLVPLSAQSTFEFVGGF